MSELPEPQSGSSQLLVEPTPSGRVSLFWGSWFLGMVALASVVLIAAHYSEEQAILNALRQARSEWLLAAIAIQSLTYLVQAVIWRAIIANGGSPLPLKASYQLSLAKLFVNQAVPTVGIGGTLFVARGLQRIGATRPQAVAGVMLDLIGYYLATAISLAAALVLAITYLRIELWVLIAVGVFFCMMLALSRALWKVLTGQTPDWLRRSGLKLIRQAVELVHQAPRAALANRASLSLATAGQFLIIVLDVVTLWLIVRALGASVAPGGVFVSLVISTLVRMFGLVPGGLGTFEAGSVAMLHQVGLPIPLALSATLLFRGLTFWLPMPVGLYCLNVGLRRGKSDRL